MNQKFSPHIALAHDYWKNALKKGDIAIDATCGNGHDALFIAKLILSEESGKLFIFDIQKKALENALTLLKNHLSAKELANVVFFEKSHNLFPPEIKQEKIKLIVYNLGYLPGGDKTITTKVETTLESIQNATYLLAEQGAISITCYSGHEEGQKEEEALIKMLSALDPKSFCVCYHKWINKEKFPSLIYIQKKST